MPRNAVLPPHEIEHAGPVEIDRRGQHAGRIEADLQSGAVQVVRGHQVVAEHAVPGLADLELLERLAADRPGSAPDDVVRVAAQHGHHVAVDRRDQVVGDGRLLGNEPAVAGRRSDLRQVVLVDRRADPIRFRPAVGIEKSQMADFRRQVGRRHAEVMDLLAAALGPAGNQQARRRLRAGGHRPADCRAGGVAGIFDNERDFVVGIVLGQQRPQVLFQIRIVSFAGREHEHPAARGVVGDLLQPDQGPAAVFVDVDRHQQRLHDGGAGEEDITDQPERIHSCRGPGRVSGKIPASVAGFPRIIR